MSGAAQVSRTVLDAPAKAAEWVHLLPARTFQGVDGRGPYHADPAAIAAASMGRPRGKVPLLIDFVHQTHLNAAAGQAAPAAGWIVELEAREDGAWGRVEWTPGGRKALAHREYRFISPVFTHDKGGTVIRLLGASLVNNPNLDQLPALNSAGTPTGEPEYATVPELLRKERDRRTPAQDEIMAALGLPAPSDKGTA